MTPLTTREFPEGAIENSTRSSTRNTAASTASFARSTVTSIATFAIPVIATTTRPLRTALTADILKRNLVPLTGQAKDRVSGAPRWA